MINFDEVTGENRREHNLHWQQIHDHSYRILIVSRFGSIKRLLNLINQPPETDKIYLHFEDLNEPKYRLLINKHKEFDLKHCKDPNIFTEYSNDIKNVYKSIKQHNPGKEEKGKKGKKVLIVFDHMIANMINNKKNFIQSSLNYLLGAGNQINLYFFSHSHTSKYLNSTHIFLMKITERQEFQQVAINNSSDIDLKDFMKLYKT